MSLSDSRTALDSFKALPGREPSLDALLRHQGMVVNGWNKNGGLKAPIFLTWKKDQRE